MSATTVLNVSFANVTSSKSAANSAAGLHSAEMYMKSYYVPVIALSGVLLNLWTLVNYNCLWPFGEQRIYKSMTAFGNILMLFFRSLVTFWFGDGLYYSTNGVAYIYLDQINNIWCSVVRSIGGVSEVVPITLTSMDVFAFHFHLMERRSSKAWTLSLFATYFIVTSAISFATYYLSSSIQPSSTNPIGQSCVISYNVTTFQILLLITQALAYALPATAMLSICFVILVRRCTRKKSDEAGHKARENPAPVLILAVTYSVIILLLFVCTLTRIVQNIQTGSNTSAITDLNNIIIMFAFILPIVDFVCLCAFRNELFHCAANSKVHALD